MRRGPYNTRAMRIVEAIRAGADTAHKLAEQFKIGREAMSVELQRLAGLGTIVRGPTVVSGIGRPCVRWRVREAAQ